MGYTRVGKYSKRAHASRAKARVIQAKTKRRTNYEKARNLKLGPVMKALVDRRINKGQETHTKNVVLHNNENVDGPIGNRDAHVLWDWLPIDQGDTHGTREGDKIKLVSCHIDMDLRVSPNVQETDSAGLDVQVLVFTPKQYQSYFRWASADAQQKADIFGKLLLDGTDEVAWDGTYEKSYLPYNPAQVIKHYSRSFSTRSYVHDNGTSGDAAQGYAGWGYTAPVFHKRLKINLKVRNKILHFENNGAQRPVSWNPIVVIGFRNHNFAKNPDTSTRVNVNSKVTLRWKNM